MLHLKSIRPGAGMDCLRSFQPGWFCCSGFFCGEDFPTSYGLPQLLTVIFLQVLERTSLGALKAPVWFSFLLESVWVPGSFCSSLSDLGTRTGCISLDVENQTSLRASTFPERLEQRIPVLRGCVSDMSPD